MKLFASQNCMAKYSSFQMNVIVECHILKTKIKTSVFRKLSVTNL